VYSSFDLEERARWSVSEPATLTGTSTFAAISPDAPGVVDALGLPEGVATMYLWCRESILIVTLSVPCRIESICFISHRVVEHAPLRFFLRARRLVKRPRSTSAWIVHT